MANANPTYVTEHEAIITVWIDGVTFPPYLRKWRTYSGGDPVAETSQFNPGGTHKAIAVPGPEKRSNVTATVGYSTQLDAIRPNIDNSLNNAMSVSYTPTDAQGNPNGRTTTRDGIFKGPTFPKHDSESGKVAELGVVMECTG